MLLCISIVQVGSIFFLLLVLSTIDGVMGRMIQFRTAKRLSLPLSREEFAGFERWWQQKSAVDIVKNNPGLLTLESKGASRYIANLAPLAFPGLTIKSTVMFDILREEKTIQVSCNQGSLEQQYEGVAFLRDLVSKLKPTVVSNNSFGIDEAVPCLFSDANLEIAFEIAPWFPVNADFLERGGSSAIGLGIDKDIGAFLENVLKAYRLESAPAIVVN